ncbi:TetR family transcriptional regulator C-terminal domain-containing protein [Microbacterium sp.]|uniref:TetR family transcriptional regulator C-terminal domain-containing protein n=1 Tax=Microbacterium sp. TaxID=51671 RepID=UPI0039E542D8
MDAASTDQPHDGARTRVRKTPDERRAEVAEAARAIAREQGLDTLTLRAVAAHMGVTPGLVAHYIPSMDDLVADAFGGLVAEELSDVVALISQVEAPRERLALLLDTLLDGSRTDITQVWVQGWAMGARNEALAARVRTEMDDWQAAIAAEIRRGMDSGVFGPGDAAATAGHLLAMIDGLNAHSIVRWTAVPQPSRLLDLLL